MDSIQKIVGFDVYSIICSYTNIPLLLYKNEICITPYVIYNNYKLIIYLDSIYSPDIERKYDHKNESLNDYLYESLNDHYHFEYWQGVENRIDRYLDEYVDEYPDKNKDLDKYINHNLYKTLIWLYNEFEILAYYEEYIIILKHIPENTNDYDIYGYNCENDNTIKIYIYNIKKRYRLYIRQLYKEYMRGRECIPITPSDIIKYFKLNPYEMKKCNISVKYIGNEKYKYMMLGHSHACSDIGNCVSCYENTCIKMKYCRRSRLMLINYKTYEIDILNYSNDCGV